jgi:hypothetical protein
MRERERDRERESGVNKQKLLSECEDKKEIACMNGGSKGGVTLAWRLPRRTVDSGG